MTTAAHPPHPPFVRRFPEGHEHAGAVVGRKSSCSRCTAEFWQYEVNPDWLTGLTERARAAYLRSCEVDAGAAGETGPRTWQPARCPKCERAALEATAPIHHLEKPHVERE